MIFHQGTASPPGQYRPVRLVKVTGSVGLSVCLFHEPEFTRLFSRVNFQDRYLRAGQRAAESLVAKGIHLVIFTDPHRLDEAIAIAGASVYLVTSPPAFPFAQHLWRYWAVSLPLTGITHWLFRGLDNAALHPIEHDLLKQWQASQADLWHAPYVKANLSHYFPVRGSCAVAHQGLRSLRAWLDRPLLPPHGGPIHRWHTDEHHLAAWWRSEHTRLKLFTVLDRIDYPTPFYLDLQTQIQAQTPFTLIKLRQRIPPIVQESS